MIGRDRAARVLAAVAFANLVVAALHFGLAAAAPLVRDHFQLGPAGLGMVLAAPALGLMLGTFLWGELADRISEHVVLVGAFAGFTLATVVAALVTGGALAYGLAVLVAGAFGSAAHSAGGRAISAAYPPERHGMVLAIRHTAIPVGGALGGIAMPAIMRSEGLDAATGASSVLGLVAMLGLAGALPSARRSGAARAGRDRGAGPSPLRHGALWLLAVGGAGLAFVQLGIGSFLTVQLVDEAGVGIGAASVVFMSTQLLGGAGRIVLGAWSDRAGNRIGILRSAAVLAAVLVAGCIVLPQHRADATLLSAALVTVTCCNALVVATAASLAPPGRTGATLGMQTTFNAGACVVAPVVLGAALEASGWIAFHVGLLVVLVGSSASLWQLSRRLGRPSPVTFR